MEGRSSACGRADLRIGAFFVFVVLFLSGSPHEVRAADGDLDMTFGGSGRVFADFASSDEYGYATVVQPNGKILVVGQSGVYPLFHSALVRLNADGTMDTTFGDGGKAIVPIDPNGDGLSAVALRPDGKIVVAGYQLHDNFTVGMIVARLNSNGSLDQTFGNGGSVIYNFGDNGGQNTAVVIQRDGKVIAVGITGASYGELVDICAARFNADGTFDNSYGIAGRVRTHFDGQYNSGSQAWGAALQPNGQLVVAGSYKNEGTPREFALARYKSDGSLDKTFGGSGMVHNSLGGAEAFGFDLAIQANGKIVVAGYFYTGHHNHDFAVARYNANGTLDTTFGAGGVLISDLFGASDDIANAVAIQSDGKIVVVGRTGQYPNFRPGLVRYNANGTFDTTFGTGGKVMSDFGVSSAQLYGCAIQPNGRIVVSGYSSSTNSDILVARYMATSMPSVKDL